MKLKGSLINFASVGSSDVNVWDTFMSDDGGSPSADPNVWITDSTDVEFLLGAAVGEGSHSRGGSDSEIAACNSTNVRIKGTQVLNSGVSAIYLVNGDSCRVENATLLNAAGWGLDIVGGSDNFAAVNNYVEDSQYAVRCFIRTSSPVVAPIPATPSTATTPAAMRAATRSMSPAIWRHSR